MQTSGIQIFYDKTGKPIQALVDLKEHGYVIEYLLDIIEIEKRKNEPTTTSEKVFPKIDKSLNKLRGKNLFPEKLAKANETIARVGLPKR
jgi:hypothetical protein